VNGIDRDEDSSNFEFSTRWSVDMPVTGMEWTTYMDEFKLPPMSNSFKSDLRSCLSRLYEYCRDSDLDGRVESIKLKISEDVQRKFLFVGRPTPESEHNRELDRENGENETRPPELLNDMAWSGNRLHSSGAIERDGTYFISWQQGDHNQQIDWGSWFLPIETSVTGDFSRIWRIDSEYVILIIDGVGHGRKAARASLKAEKMISKHITEPVNDLMTRVDEALRKTRGGVAFIGRIDANRNVIQYCSVGNIRARLVRSKKSLVSLNGIVGYQLPPLKKFTQKLSSGEIILWHTDGVTITDHSYYDEIFERLNPIVNCRRILHRFGKGTDDALVSLLSF